MSNKNIVVIGGGTGSFTVLSGLKLFSNLNLQAIVNMVDNGGSTGKLRDELGVLPPGDIRQCLVALAESPEILRQLFNYRFDCGELTGHNFGNLFLSALEKITGNFEEGVKTAGDILSIRGEVIPVTTDNINLSITLENGTELLGQTKMHDAPEYLQYPVKKLKLIPKAKLNHRAKKAIMKADSVIIGPGLFYGSLLPNLIVPGMSEVLAKTEAQIIYNVNLMSTVAGYKQWSVEEHIKQLNKFIGAEVIDIALYNTTEPDPKLVEKYKEEGEPVVKANKSNKVGNTTLIGADLIADGIFINPNKKDPLRRTLIRHDPLKLAEALYRLI
jgi:uncharacterized cofD-like protein